MIFDASPMLDGFDDLDASESRQTRYNAFTLVSDYLSLDSSRQTGLRLRGTDSDRTRLLALPPGLYLGCLTPPLEEARRGGFVFDPATFLPDDSVTPPTLYFAPGLINLNADRDSYRQFPIALFNDYTSSYSFNELILHFEQHGAVLARTIDSDCLFYDYASWPNHEIPDLGVMTYEEALEELLGN